ncbi:MAG TPA: NAD(P)-dependent oxidoreductase, partial [Nitrososphaeraceae archaeon]|nr:NAD(P)-dependent oxidoreductase [Nitrososphaeraceae archaeon]
MKVLISGGAGYIGTVLTKLLLSKGYQVTVYDNLRYKQTVLLDQTNNPNFNFIYGDVRDRDKFIPLIKQHNIIVPLAALVGAPLCEKNKNEAKDINYYQIIDIL